MQLISVIIPCYNHARFLAKAIESVLEQSYKNYEIIVVDDGSTDNTREVASRYTNVLYVYQSNQGLSASRNAGIKKSKGEYLVFLDADDWLLPDALLTNIRHFKADRDAAFVAGAYILLTEKDNSKRTVIKATGDIGYNSLLKGNIISMHGAVMFQRWVFDHFQYDTSLRSCEDWDIYLKISRTYSVRHHTEPIAVYRRYGSSMSSNFSVMLECGLRVLNQQKPMLQGKAERLSFTEGKKRLKDKYKKKIYHSILSATSKPPKNEVRAIYKYDKWLFLKIMIKRRFKLLSCLF